jgi:fatty acid desaturase
VVIVAVEIAFRVALTAWCRGAPQTDARDRLIAAKAARNAYYVLVTGLFILIGYAGLASLIGYIDQVRLDVPMAIVLGVFVLVVAEVVHYGSRILYYRFGS